MSVVAKPLRKPRIISIPLTRPKASAKLDRMLTYYQFQINGDPKPRSTTKNSTPGWLPEEGVANWLTGKAVNTWAGFGKAESGWRRRTYEYGERLMDRMDFEELALKNIDPSLGPSIAHLSGGHTLGGKGKEKESSAESLAIPLLYPPSLTNSSAALHQLRRHVEDRIPRHRRGLYMWGAVTPLTFPLKFIPIIPNLPFFFCVWRCWSHYRAYKASEYLETLLDNNLIVPQASEVLDGIYNEFSPLASSSTSTTNEARLSPSDANPTSSEPDAPSAEHQHTLLLTREAVPVLLANLRLTENEAGADLYRAVEQARLRVESGKLEL